MNTQSQNPKAMSVITRGVYRPKWVCGNAKQVAVVVGDDSGSMEGRKAEDASAAMQDFVGELAQPCNKDGFFAAVVHFSSDSEVVNDLEKVTSMIGKIKPLEARGGSTNITAGLNDALRILDQAEKQNQNQDGVIYLRPVVLLFSDGEHNDGPPPQPVADQIKQKADLVTVAFGSDADEALLRSLASTPQHFYRCSSGRQLRQFLAAVGATMTATMAARTNATQALTTIRQ
jgi:uncharacterized protein YegL